VKTLSVLFVEDDIDTVCGTIAGLIRLGHKVDVSNDITDATKKLRYKNYDFVIVDINLKERNDSELDTSGLDLINEIEGGRFDERNSETVYALYTNQRRSLNSKNVKQSDRYFGVYSKNSYAKFLLNFRKRFG